MNERKIAAVGDADSVMGFAAVGIDVFAAVGDAASHKLHELARAGYAIIFVTENIAADVEEAMDRYKTVAYPAIVVIPGTQGSTGAGFAHVRKSMEKAVGMDLFANENLSRKV